MARPTGRWTALMCRAGALSAAASMAGATACQKAPPPAFMPPPPEVGVVHPEMREVDVTFDTTGVTRSVETLQLRARVRGFVAKRHVEGGSRVSKGQLVFTIDKRPFEAAVASAKAAEDQAKAQLALAELTLGRMKDAVRSNAVSQYELDRAQADRDAAAAAVDLAAARLTEAKLDLEFTEVRSPTDGRLSVQVIDEGQYVGDNEATLLGTVVNDKTIFVTFQIDERSLQRRYAEIAARPGENGRPDMVVMLGLDGDEGYRFSGRFSRADPGIDPGTGTITCEAEFDNSEGRLLPGAFVRVRCLIGRERGLLVPDAAIMVDQRGRYVYVVKPDGKEGGAGTIAHRVDVHVGPPIGQSRRITPDEQGRLPLSESDTVVLEGVHKVRPESPVTAAPAHRKPATPPAPAPAAAAGGA